jgi:hypothetical protein
MHFLDLTPSQMKRFALELMNDHEILFRSQDTGLDVAGYSIDEYERIGRNPAVAIKLLREIERAVKSYVRQHKPPYVFYTAGFDVTRFPLYRRPARKLAKVGYRYAEDSERENIFYCYRGVSPALSSQ